MYFQNFGEGPIPAAGSVPNCPGGWVFVSHDVTHGSQNYCWPTMQQYQAALQAMQGDSEEATTFTSAATDAAQAVQQQLPPVSTNAQGMQVGSVAVPWWAVVIGAVLLLRR